MRAAGPAPVRLAGRSTRRLLQLHRRLVQPSQAPLRPGLPLAHPLRAGHENGTATSQAPNCPRDRGNFRMDRAQAADDAEGAQHGRDRRGDEMPDWMADKQRRLERIRAAKAQLEAEAEAGPGGNPDGPGPSSGMQERGKRKAGTDDAEAPKPPDKAQRNFTDPD